MGALKLQSILVATDLSEGSDPLVRAAAAIAALVGAELHLVHSLDARSLADSADAVRAAGEVMDAQLTRSVPASGGVTIASREVLIYAPHRAILDRAAQVEADLIVLGPHRPGPRLEGMLGTTADRVIRSSNVPTLVVPNELRVPLRKVLAPIDLSEPARAALDLGVQWASALGPNPDDGPAVLQVLHVAQPAAEAPDQDLDAVNERLQRETGEAHERGGVGSAPILEPVLETSPDAATAIVSAAERNSADLVVMGTHGFGAIRRVVVGSVASAVVRRAPCPVLLVPPSIWRSPEARIEDA